MSHDLEALFQMISEDDGINLLKYSAIFLLLRYVTMMKQISNFTTNFFVK